MPQINEFSWLMMATKLMVMMMTSYIVLNYSNYFTLPTTKSNKMNFFKNVL